MKLPRRTVITAITGALLYSTSDARSQDNAQVADESDSFLGIWSTHYQQTFIYLVIQPNNKAIFALLDQGHSFSEVPWFRAENGIIVGGLPMFRLWKTTNPKRCKVQMQAVPPEATNSTFIKFPLNFYMGRQPQRTLPDTLAELKVPNNWLNAEPRSDFDDVAGKPRKVSPN